MRTLSLAVINYAGQTQVYVTIRELWGLVLLVITVIINSVCQTALTPSWLQRGRPTVGESVIRGVLLQR